MWYPFLRWKYHPRPKPVICLTSMDQTPLTMPVTTWKVSVWLPDLNYCTGCWLCTFKSMKNLRSACQGDNFLGSQGGALLVRRPFELWKNHYLPAVPFIQVAIDGYGFWKYTQLGIVYWMMYFRAKPFFSWQKLTNCFILFPWRKNWIYKKSANPWMKRA